MDLRFDAKLTATVKDLQEKLNLDDSGAVVRRAIALLSVCSEGVLRGERLYLITPDSRKEIII